MVVEASATYQAILSSNLKALNSLVIAACYGQVGTGLLQAKHRLCRHVLAKTPHTKGVTMVVVLEMVSETTTGIPRHGKSLQLKERLPLRPRMPHPGGRRGRRAECPVRGVHATNHHNVATQPPAHLFIQLCNLHLTFGSCSKPANRCVLRDGSQVKLDGICDSKAQSNTRVRVSRSQAMSCGSLPHTTWVNIVEAFSSIHVECSSMQPVFHRFLTASACARWCVVNRWASTACVARGVLFTSASPALA